ncbi:hypothetical protein [Streptomyces sp. NPDC057623]|uniref:hypothetical protein n=1 Tax=Streptomyces sp. NPDC057623 TaxID=3346187 RepID=UPI00368178A2
MAEVVFGICAGLIAVSSALYLYLVWSQRTFRLKVFAVARRARVVAFTACFICSLTAVPSVATAVDGFTGRDGAGTLCSNLTAQAAVFSLQIMSVVWTRPEDDFPKAVVGWIFLLGAVAAVLVWEFHLTDVPSVQLASASPNDSAAAAYMLTHVCVLTVVVSALSVRYGRMAAAVWPHRRAAALGLAVTAMGTIVGLGYAVGRAAAIISHLMGQPQQLMDSYVVPATGGLATLFITLGLTLPTIRRRIILPAGSWPRDNSSSHGSLIRGDS